MLKQGQRVVIEYSCTLADGTVCDSTEQQGKPLEFIFGSEQQVLPAVFSTVEEMRVGETRTIVVSAAEAYGLYDDALIETVPRENFPNAEQLPVGEYIVVSTEAGNARIKVVEVSDTEVVLDFNHELAGQDLSYTLTLVDLPGCTGSLVEREKHLTGTCGCGCDELRHALAHS